MEFSPLPPLSPDFFEPMLLRDAEPFDSAEYYFELKFDGVRALAWLDPARRSVVLVNRRRHNVTELFPELLELYRQVNSPCVLDGEIVVLKDGKPDFPSVLSRSAPANGSKARTKAIKNPAQFVAFDIPSLNGESLFSLPLSERKRLLGQTVEEGGGLALSRYVENRGIDFFRLAAEEGLEGVVAKRKDSPYRSGKRTGEWLKMKTWQEEEFAVCGYVLNDEGKVKDLVLGGYDEAGELKSAGIVYAGVSPKNREKLLRFAERYPSPPLFAGRTGAGRFGAGNSGAEIHWILPELVASVRYLERTEAGGLRNPVFLGFREDKRPQDCTLPQ